MALSLDSCIRFNSASMILATASVMRTDFWQLQCTDEFAFLANEKLHPGDSPSVSFVASSS